MHFLSVELQIALTESRGKCVFSQGIRVRKVLCLDRSNRTRKTVTEQLNTWFAPVLISVSGLTNVMVQANGCE